jgi:uncharacterized protein (DUF697 family)
MNDELIEDDSELDSEPEGKPLKIVRWITEKAIEGVPPLASADTLVQEYLDDETYLDHGDRIDSLIRWETTKNFTSGFLTGLGGVLTLPVTLPASFGASWIVQARMSAAIAKLSGHDIHSDRVQTFVIASLLGDGVKEILKQTGIQIGKGLAKGLLKQIPGKVLILINKQVGFRLLTKAGSTGAVNLVKIIPFIGGAVGGTVDAYMCKAVGNTAKSIFYRPFDDSEDNEIAGDETEQTE